MGPAEAEEPAAAERRKREADPQYPSPRPAVLGATTTLIHKVPLTWPECHRSESEIDRLLVTRALVGECFDYNGGMRDHKALISIFN